MTSAISWGDYSSDFLSVVFVILLGPSLLRTGSARDYFERRAQRAPTPKKLWTKVRRIPVDETAFGGHRSATNLPTFPRWSRWLETCLCLRMTGGSWESRGRPFRFRNKQTSPEARSLSNLCAMSLSPTVLSSPSCGSFRGG